MASRETTLGLGDALWTGAWIGGLVALVATTPAGLLYYLRWSGVIDAPWAELAAQGVSFVAVTGAFYGASITAAVARLGTAGRLASTLAGATGGALGGIVPGAYAALRFGTNPFPWFGAAPILSAVVLAVALFALTLVRAIVPKLRLRDAAVAAFVPAPLALLVMTPLAALTFLADADLDMIRIVAARASLPGAGAAVGIVVGIVLGGWLGASVGFARGKNAIRRSAASTEVRPVA